MTPVQYFEGLGYSPGDAVAAAHASRWRYEGEISIAADMIEDGCIYVGE